MFRAEHSAILTGAIAHVDRSGKFHLGRRDDERILPLRGLVQLDLGDAPAVVFERALERRLARDVAGQTDRGRVEADGHFDGRFLLAFQDGLHVEMLAQDFLTGLVDGAHAGAERFVVRPIDVFQEEVDEPTFALHERQQQDRLRRWLRRRRRGRRRERHLDRFFELRVLHISLADFMRLPGAGEIAADLEVAVHEEENRTNGSGAGDRVIGFRLHAWSFLDKDWGIIWSR